MRVAGKGGFGASNRKSNEMPTMDAETALLYSETPDQAKIGKYHEVSPSDHSLISNLAGVSFTLNFIMGVGFLGLPWAFAQTGLVLGSLLMVFITGLSLITASYVLDAMARTEALTRVQLDKTTAHEEPVMQISHRKFEIVEMVELYMGEGMKRVYIVIVSLYLAGVLWSYTSVFGSAMSAHVPLPFVNGGNVCDIYHDHTDGCHHLYQFWVLLFCIVMIAVSCLDLKEQVAVQMTMSVMRGGLITLMVTTVIMALTSSQDLFGHSYNVGVHDSVGSFFRPKGILLFFPVAVYSQLFHTGIPVLSQPLRVKKGLLWRVFGTTYAITLSIYVLASCIIALYFGTSVDQSCNVTWSHFVGYLNADGSTPLWASIISYGVVLFPALDVLSVAPLNSIILASNVMGSIYGPRTPKMESKRYMRVLYRIGCAVPPCIGAAFIFNLDTVLNYTGIIGLGIGFCLPPALFEMSRRACLKQWPHSKLATGPSYYWFSNATVARVVFVFGVISIIAVTVMSIVG